MREGCKDTDIDLIPIDWKIVELSDIAKCTVGIATSTTHAYCENGVLLLRNQNIKEGKIALNDVLYINTEFDELNKSKRLKENDIITVRTGYPGISAVVPKELEGAQSFTTLIIRLKKQNPLSNFLCYYINSSKGKTFFTDNQAGGGQQNVGAKTLERMKIPIPPLPEQQKIAEILSTVDAKIEVIDQQIIETQALKKGLMQRLLTKGIGHTEFKNSSLGEIPKSWEVVKLSDVCDKIGDGIHSTPKYVESSEYYFVNGNNLVNGTLKISEKTKCVSKDEYEKLKIKLNLNSVLMSINGTIGNLALYKNEEVIFGKSASYISANEDVFHYLYLYYFLQHSNTKKYFFDELTGSTIQNLSLKTIRNTPTLLPSKSEQIKIAEILSSVDEKLEVLSEKKTHYQELKQGLMQQLLTGKVRVNYFSIL